MEGNFVEVLFFLLAFGYVAIRAILRDNPAPTKTGKDVAGEALPQSGTLVGDSFPAIEILPAAVPESKVKKDVAPTRRKEKPTPVSVKPVAVKGAVATESSEKDKLKISIKNKSDAKRAIISAEIFNRKYF